MTVSAHEAMALYANIIPAMKAAGLDFLILPGANGESDIHINLPEGHEPDFSDFARERASVRDIFEEDSRSGELTIDYLYRDADNNKQFERIKLEGTVTLFHAAVIYTALTCDGEDHFIPEKLGLEPLQERWNDTNYDHDGPDHPYHELSDLFFKEAAVSADVDQIEEFTERCLAVVKDMK